MGKSILIKKLRLTPILDPLIVKEIAQNPHCGALTFPHDRIKSTCQTTIEKEVISEAREKKDNWKLSQVHPWEEGKVPLGI